MRKPYVYLCVNLNKSPEENEARVNDLCRAVYEAGFTPYCPAAFLSHFLRDGVPAEHKDGVDISRDFLRRAHMLVLCDEPDNEEMKNELATAQRYSVPATTLEGFLEVAAYGRKNREG